MNIKNKELHDKLKIHHDEMLDLVEDCNDTDFDVIKDLINEINIELDEIDFANDHEDDVE